MHNSNPPSFLRYDTQPGTVAQMRLDFGEGAEAERAAIAAADKSFRARRAIAFENAAMAAGIRPGEIGYKLAGLLAVFADSPSMRALGLTGLRWRGTVVELAENARLCCSVRTVQRALARLEQCGFIAHRLLKDSRGWCGIEIELHLAAIDQAAILCDRLPQILDKSAAVEVVAPGHVTRGVTGDVGGDTPGDMGGDMGGDISNSLYSSVNPYFPKEPPPRIETTKNNVAADYFDGSETNSWAEVADALRAVGLERVASAQRVARDAGLAPDECLAILAEYSQHKTRFRGPGAIVDRFRSGGWPVRLPSAEDTANAKSRAEEKQSRVARDRVRYLLAKEWQAAGRWRTTTEAEIEAEIDRRCGVVGVSSQRGLVEV